MKNLVFEGGGIRGIAYAGAIEELQNQNVLGNIERVAGTSVGALVATLLAVDYTPNEIKQIISETNFKKFADGQFIFIGGTRRMITKYGWYKGEKFRKWIGEIIEIKTGKPDLTFKELHELKSNNKKELYITATNLSKQTKVLFSYETYPDMEIRNAVRISMSIPMYFTAMRIDKDGNITKDKNADVFVDGGIIANYPIQIFDELKYTTTVNKDTNFVNFETLGLRLDRKEQIEYDNTKNGLAPYEISDFKTYTESFYNIIIENLNRQNLTEDDWKRTISINTLEIGPKIKRLSKEEKLKLMNSGSQAVKTYFQKIN
ncbi:MAG: patatin-like phospholipase family protein [Bacteroidia bacterium]|nr:patatin-like phospholipase family protein [Bacteroidia bacterium]MBN4052382.1 patatin-like phospholipase family protein [Sphingobacteriaceae bacterium AH-315-L07]